MAILSALLLSLVVPANAQPRQADPYIGYVYPAGGERGTEFEVTLGGQHLDGVIGAVVTGGGIEAIVTGYTKPMSAQQLAALRERQRELARRRAEAAGELGPAKASSLIENARGTNFRSLTDDDDDNDLESALEAQRAADSKKQLNPQLAEGVTLYITIARNAEPGQRLLRLKTRTGGLSNPIFFHVGSWEEYHEREPNDRSPDAGVPQWLPVTINGQILPGDVDRFRFHAIKGNRIVAAVSAQSLIPYLADAVPGWFQATLTLFDSRGRQLAYADDFRFLPDPVIVHDVQETGDYILEIKDSIYRGREDFVYRISLGQMPLVTGIFPLGGPVGQKTTAQVRGVNLAGGESTLVIAGESPGLFAVKLSAGRPNVMPGRVLFALDTLPEITEAEPNDKPEQANKLDLPVTVNGRIDKPGDWDTFAFTGRAGEKIVAEVLARRLGSPLDSLLKLTDAAGKIVAFNDDHTDQAAAFTTHHADSLLAVTLSADGEYRLVVGDTQGNGGSEFAYRLRVGPPRPDFQLRVVPSALNVPPGGTVPITIHAVRSDGFAGRIDLALTDPGPGFVLTGGWIPAGQNSVRATLTVNRPAEDRQLHLRMVGTATIDGRQVSRPAVPADDLMQAFAYRHLVPTSDWLITVTGRVASSGRLSLIGSGPVKVPLGGTGQVRIAAPKGASGRTAQVALFEPPDGITVEKVTADGEQVIITIAADAEKAKAGVAGNLIAEGWEESPILNREGKPTGRTRKIPLGMLPAIPYEIVPQPEEELPTSS